MKVTVYLKKCSPDTSNICFRVREKNVRKVFGGKGEDFVVQQFGVEEQFGVDVPSFVL